MIYLNFIEKSGNEHILLLEWIETLKTTPNMQLAKDTVDNYKYWFGYSKNPLSKSEKQFHNKEERVYDGEILFEGNWLRVFYWHPLKDENGNFGVVSFENGVLSPIATEILKNAEILCSKLKAEITTEETSKYQS